MTDTKPADFQSINDWFAEQGKPVFPSVKMLYYHVGPVQKDLIEAGAMAKVGERIFLHKSRFWPEYQRIVASQLGVAR